jgi:hypothetical protein
MSESGAWRWGEASSGMAEEVIDDRLRIESLMLALAGLARSASN